MIDCLLPLTYGDGVGLARKWQIQIRYLQHYIILSSILSESIFHDVLLTYDLSSFSLGSPGTLVENLQALDDNNNNCVAWDQQHHRAKSDGVIYVLLT